MPCFPRPPAGWMEYERIHGKYKGNQEVFKEMQQVRQKLED